MTELAHNPNKVLAVDRDEKGEKKVVGELPYFTHKDIRGNTIISLAAKVNEEYQKKGIGTKMYSWLKEMRDKAEIESIIQPVYMRKKEDNIIDILAGNIHEIPGLSNYLTSGKMLENIEEKLHSEESKKHLFARFSKAQKEFPDLTEKQMLERAVFSDKRIWRHMVDKDKYKMLDFKPMSYKEQVSFYKSLGFKGPLRRIGDLEIYHNTNPATSD